MRVNSGNLHDEKSIITRKDKSKATTVWDWPCVAVSAQLFAAPHSSLMSNCARPPGWHAALPARALLTFHAPVAWLLGACPLSPILETWALTQAARECARCCLAQDDRSKVEVKWRSRARPQRFVAASGNKLVNIACYSAAIACDAIDFHRQKCSYKATSSCQSKCATLPPLAAADG